MSIAVDTARRGGAIVAPLLCVLFLFALPAGAAPAPGGTVQVAQDCNGWSARVELNHKVAPFRTVNVTSTIPGHPGIVDGTYDSTFGLIWLATGSEHDLSGVVTLTISAGTNPIFTAMTTLIPATGCTPDVTTTSSSTTTTTEPTLPVQGRQDPEVPTARVSVPTEIAETGPIGVGALGKMALAALWFGACFLFWSRRAS